MSQTRVKTHTTTKLNLNRDHEPWPTVRARRLEDQVQRLETFNALALTTLREVKHFMVFGTRGSHAERDLLKKISKVIA